MNTPTLGIIGGGQLGSLLADAAKKIDIQTVISVSYTHLRAHET